MNDTKPFPGYPFDNFLAYVTRLNDVLNLSIEGLLRVSSMVPLVKALANLPTDLKRSMFEREENQKEEEQRIERAERLANLAKEEISNNFNLLHSQTVVSLWGGLEVLVKDLAIASLKFDPDLLKNEPFRSIKIPLADFQSLSETDQFDFLIQEVIRDKRADYKPGVAKFESILEAVNLNGPVEDKIRKTFFEMSKVRNVLVHKAGLVDQKLLKECPWLELEIGDQVLIDHPKYVDYMDAVQEYAIILLSRVMILHDMKYKSKKESDS